MKLILFAHPRHLGSTSMALFSEFIYSAATNRNCEVEIWTPSDCLYRLPAPSGIKKWLGYLDQYVIFPFKIRRKSVVCGGDVLFVFSDQALGPWVKLVSDRPHVIHVHDFIALRSACGEFPQCRLSWTGRLYQKYIRAGFNRGRNFICISDRSKTDLVRFLDFPERASIEVVLNGLNYPYSRRGSQYAKRVMSGTIKSDMEAGFLLHVGGNQWYKNRSGVLEIYNAYVSEVAKPLPLIMIGEQPNHDLLSQASALLAPAHVEFVVRPPVEVVEAAYSMASFLIFPSIAEGFGWPILEAMSCGCPVLTTDDAPMTEIAGSAAMYLPTYDYTNVAGWAKKSSSILINSLNLSSERRQELVNAGIARALRFDAEGVIEAYFHIYQNVLKKG